MPVGDLRLRQLTTCPANTSDFGSSHIRKHNNLTLSAYAGQLGRNSGACPNLTVPAWHGHGLGLQQGQLATDGFARIAAHSVA